MRVEHLGAVLAMGTKETVVVTVTKMVVAMAQETVEVTVTKMAVAMAKEAVVV